MAESQIPRALAQLSRARGWSVPTGRRCTFGVSLVGLSFWHMQPFSQFSGAGRKVRWQAGCGRSLAGLNGRQLADAARVKRPGLKILLMTGYAESVTIKPPCEQRPVYLR